MGLRIVSVSFNHIGHDCLPFIDISFSLRPRTSW
jgi:hypothetical protein